MDSYTEQRDVLRGEMSLLGKEVNDIRDAGMPEKGIQRRLWYEEIRNRNGRINELNRRLSMLDIIHRMRDGADKVSTIQREEARIQRWDSGHVRTLRKLDKLRQASQRRQALPALKAMRQTLIIPFDEEDPDSGSEADVGGGAGAMYGHALLPGSRTWGFRT